MLDKKELRCHTEGCGHKLDFHMVTPRPRCRVAMCRCDKWRAYPDPTPAEQVDLPKNWEELIRDAVTAGAIVVIAPPEFQEEKLQIELVRRALFPDPNAPIAHLNYVDPDDR